jgi:hypothetical protein
MSPGLLGNPVSHWWKMADPQQQLPEFITTTNNQLRGLLTRLPNGVKTAKHTQS